MHIYKYIHVSLYMLCICRKGSCRHLEATLLSSFSRPVELTCAALICQGHERSVAIASGSRVEICNGQGVVQKTIQFSEEEDESTYIYISNIIQ